MRTTFVMVVVIALVFASGAVFLETLSYPESEVAIEISAAVSRVRESASLRRKINKLDDEIVDKFPVPILFGVSPDDVSDTWGDARDNDRTHEGTDIFAPRGALVVSPTEAVVTSIGYGEIGGNYVYTTNPGGERFYFAHLDRAYEHLKIGDELSPGDLIGYVGDTGNAKGGTPHLHFGIYRRGAQNPFERLTEEFSPELRVLATEKILEEIDEPKNIIAKAREIVSENRAVFLEANEDGIRMSPVVLFALSENRPSTSATNDLTIGSTGASVRALQSLLIKENKGPAARTLASAGATGNFGPATQAALQEFQIAVGITAIGYFGPATQSYLRSLGKW